MTQTSLMKHIGDLEQRATESDLAGAQTTDVEAKLYYAGLARKLRSVAARLLHAIDSDADESQHA